MAVDQAAPKNGRPSKFTQEIADEICNRLSQGEPLAKICRDSHMPDPSTVGRWKEGREELSHAIARAREEGFDAIAIQCLEIADETSRDTIDTETGERANSEWISRSKLRVETRLKLLAKWDPKRYGDKLQLGGDQQNPIALLISGINGGALPIAPDD